MTHPTRDPVAAVGGLAAVALAALACATPAAPAHPTPSAVSGRTYPTPPVDDHATTSMDESAGVVTADSASDRLR